jgi:hypothetical protein
MQWLFDGCTARVGAWRLITDQVMGGLSTGVLTAERLDGEDAAVLRGQVRLDHGGGFVQMALDLEGALEGSVGPRLDPAQDPPPHVARHAGEAGYETGGVSIRLWAPPGQRAGIHLRTLDLGAPWQSFRAPQTGSGTWQAAELPWSAFLPYRTDRPLEPARLVRLGVVVIGSAGQALVGVSRLGIRRTSRTGGPGAPGDPGASGLQLGVGVPAMRSYFRK